MSTGIKLTSKVDGPGVAAAAEAIMKVLSMAYECHADQATIRHALDTLGRFGGLEGASINNCQVTT